MAKKNIATKKPTICNKCGIKPTDLFNYKDLHLCFNCFDYEIKLMQVNIMMDEEERIEKNDFVPTKPERVIAKTSRWVVANREVNINQFTDGIFSVTTTRHVTPFCENAAQQIATTTHYSPETLCLLVEALNKTITDYNIDSNALLKNLKGESKIYQTFHDFKLNISE